MIEFFYFVFVSLISFALGKRALKAMGFEFVRLSEDFAFCLPLGFAILANITFFFGIIGLLYKSAIITVLLIIFIFLIKDILAILSKIFKFIKDLNVKRFSKKFKSNFNFFYLAAGFLLLLLLLNFIDSFAPPWNFDVLTYHLAIPKIYARAHSIIYIPYMFFSNFPSLIDAIYLIGLLLHSGELSNLFAYILGAALVSAIYSFCKKFYNAKIAVLASLIFYSFPMIIGLSSNTYIDIQLALFVFLSFYSLFVYFESKNKKWLVLCSIFAGLGASSQAFGSVAAFGILIMLIINLVQRLAQKTIDYRTAFFSIMAFGLIIFFITLPWLLKSYVYTGNPVWPVFNEIFMGKYWDAKHQQGLSNLINFKERSLANYLRLPWDIHTPIIKDKENVYEERGIGPFFLAFLPLYFLLKKKNKIISQFFLMIFIYMSIWFFLSFVFRYIIFITPLIAIICAYVIAELFENKYAPKIVKALLTFTFVYGLMIWVAGNAKEMPVVLGLQTKDEFYLKYVGSIYKASGFINSNLPKNSKILLFRDNRGFFLDREYVWADPVLQDYIDYFQFRNEDDFYNELKKLGITHILVNNELEWRGFVVNEYRYSARIMEMLNKLSSKYSTNIYNNDGITISELK